MVDHQEGVRPQLWIGQRIGDAADHLVGLRPDDRRVRIEHDVEIEMRQLEKLRRDRRPPGRRRIGARLNSIGSLLAQRGRIDLGGGLGTDQLIDQAGAGAGVCAVAGRIGNASASDAPPAGRSRAVSVPTTSAVPRRVDRLVAVRRRLLGKVQQALQPLGSILPDLAAQVFSSQLHSFERVARAVTRCSMAPKMRAESARHFGEMLSSFRAGSPSAAWGRD